MERQREAISIIGEEKRVVSQQFSNLLDDLIQQVEGRDFDCRVFNELYLDLLSCTSRIFELEKASYGMEKGAAARYQYAIPYRTFHIQLARLNEKCLEKGIGQSHSMLEFLLEWFAKKYDASVREFEIRDDELSAACA